MKRKLLIVTFIISVLGNILTLTTIIGAWLLLHHVTHVANGVEEGDGGSSATVVDIITTDIDGYKESHLIADFHGQRIVVNNVAAVVPKQKPIAVGDKIQVQEKKLDLGMVKMLSFTVIH